MHGTPWSGAKDLSGAELADGRLRRRLATVASALEARPDQSFPDVFEEEPDLEAFYRLLRNPVLSFVGLVHTHAEEAFARAEAAPEDVYLVLHDTTEFGFEGDSSRAGLTKQGAKHKFWGHAAIAVAATGAPHVFGVVGLDPYVQRDGAWVRVATDDHHALAVGSERWTSLVVDVESRRGPGKTCIHVMDREGDAFPLLAEMAASKHAFVVRSTHDRVLTKETTLGSFVASMPVAAEREIAISRRSAKGRPPASRATHPDRNARITKVNIRFGTVTLPAPREADLSDRSPLTVNVVDVVEPNPPPGEAPVHWRLFTLLPVTDAASALRVVDIYRRRWIIEEYFKALKTGCAYERRQLESLRTLRIALGILAPIAACLLNLRVIGRAAPDADPAVLINDVQLELLRGRVSKSVLPKKPNARDIMLAVASLGGHIRHNGMPGWQTLARGWEKLLLMEYGWRAARGELGQELA